MEGEVAGQAGNDHPTGIPTGVFPASDGHINIAACSARLWAASARRSAARMAGEAGLEDAQAAAAADRTAINAAIAEITKTSTPPNYWIELFEEAGIPAARSTTSTRCSRTRRCSTCGMASRCRMGDTAVVDTADQHRRPHTAVRRPTPGRASIRMRSCEAGVSPMTKSRRMRSRGALA